MGNSVEKYTDGQKWNYRDPRKRNLLKTGDIVLFSGFGLDSSMVKCFTTTVYSHIGIVMRLPGFEPKNHERDPDDLYLWHSTLYSYSHVPDLIKGTRKSGVQLNSFKEVMENYDGRIVLRGLSNKIDISVPEIVEWMGKYDDCIYEWAATELINSVYWGKCPVICKSGDNAFFCSELATKTYVDLFKIMKVDRDFASFIPEDYATGGRVSRYYLRPSKRLTLGSYYLKKEVELYYE